MRLLLSVGAAADPHCQVQIRILPSEAGPPTRELGAFNVDPDPGSTFAVHRLVSEIWVFSGSHAAVTAASECWREHFRIEEDGITQDHDAGWEPD